MIKHILVPIAGTAADAALLANVFDLARPLFAHVEVLHVRRDPRRDLPLYGEGLSPEMLDTILPDAEKHAAETAAAARRMFEEAVAGSSVTVAEKAGEQGRITAGWREIVGPPARTLAAEARFADLTVLPPPGREPADLLRLEGALFEAGRPVLLADGDMARLDTVVIAWDGSLAAVRAVACAQEFIERATAVFILAVEEGSMHSVSAVVSGRPAPHPERLAEHLAWHGVQATVRRVERDGKSVGETLAAAAMDLNTGLLVMGGYGHSRLRDMVLGGATRCMLTSPVGCPVLLAH